jgi:hypothetical protein
VIPTLGREEKQKVIYQFPEDLRDKLYLATREDHVDLLHKHNPGFNIIPLPQDTYGIAQTRQRCLEAIDSDKIWMLDDIVKLQKKNEEYRVIGKASSEEVRELYDLIDYLLDFHVQVGVSQRPGNDKYTVWKRDNTRSYTCYGLRKDYLNKLGIRFTGMYEKDPEIIFFEDFYLTLSLLTKGYSNTLIWDYICDHHHNRPGGNSLVRTPEKYEKGYEALKNEFPKYVKLKKVDRYSWGKGMQGERTEATIYWKKAFADSLENRLKRPLF